MRVIPVLDLRSGRAVHAAGGSRARYRPVRGRLAAGDDPAALAAAFRLELGARECYVADLDAIEGGAVQLAAIRAIADAGLAAWVDAGTTDPGRAAELLAAGAAIAVVGSETLRGAERLDAIAAAILPDRLAFSLDLREGRPLAPAAPELDAAEPGDVVGWAVRAGYRRVIALDLARVGTEAGPPVELARALHAAFPDIELVAGGGVRGPDDLRRLARAGCAGALVGTALHAGRITRADIESLEAR